MMGEELLNFSSVKRWISSLEQSAVGRGKTFGESNKFNRLWHLSKYTTKLNPDELLQEAKNDLEKTMIRLTTHFNAVQKNGMSWNTACTHVSFLRGFYTHNDIVFPKRFKSPKPRISDVSKTDCKTEIYGYDEDKDEIVFKNGFLQHFISNLNFRDQTIALCLLSTGADSAELLRLKVGFVRDGKGNLSTAKRFLLHENRQKDGIEFKVFFSEEATHFLKRFVEQERSNAKSNELIFIKEDGQELPVHALAMNFRLAAEKMGFAQDEKSNPFRPKRFRHLFRTACSIANIDEGFVNAMMGHASNISGTYLEKSDGLFLKEYLKVEPYVTVYGGIDKSQITLMNENYDELKQKYEVAEKEIENNRIKIIQLYDKQQQDKERLEEQVKSMYTFVHKNLDPLLDVIDELSKIPEGAEALRQLRANKIAQRE
jgi:integrase